MKGRRSTEKRGNKNRLESDKQLFNAKQNDVNTSRKRFTQEEDFLLKNLVDKLGMKLWDEIALYMPNRTARQCRDRYNNYLYKEITHQPWSPEEDKIILEKYHEYGPHWVKIARFLSGRSGNNVKNRWHKYLKRFISTPTNQNQNEQEYFSNQKNKNDTSKDVVFQTDFNTDFFSWFKRDSNSQSLSTNSIFENVEF